MPRLPDPDTLAMMISNSIYINYGFGPSRNVCLPFAKRVLAEHHRIERMRDQ